ncbi:hypothetical protein [Nocardioides jiangxiensis]|uniref:Septum formation-related domain-containing protein n=1 Tax=Nocardioides jiangxiensis TaxID=3064524 RepID=A0ABT9B445_9ACTN|nr:hypothetical protein [Nocardioides sp. WY-20]MDO7869084.1 hypothetical protein [Nocardioides sp. WY-20]
MAEQPTWRGHRAPVEDAEPAHTAPPARRVRWTLLAGLAAAAAVIGSCAVLTSRLVHHDPATLPDITVGTCLSSTDLARGRTSLQHLDALSCSRLHDAEVFALRTISPGEDLDAVASRCLEAAEDLGVDASALAARHLEVRPLALTDKDPTPGVPVACFVRQQNGAPLRGAVFTGSDR